MRGLFQAYGSCAQRVACGLLDGPEAAGVELLCKNAVTQLHTDPRLREIVCSMREANERGVGFAGDTGDASMAQQQPACQKAIAAIIEDLGFDSACAALDPLSFKQAVYAFSGQFSKAPLRRSAREMARIYTLLVQGSLPIPRRVEDFRLMWEAAMEGEPRWSEDFPSSDFRTRPSRILDSLFKGNVIQVNTDSKNVEKELAQLLAFLADEQLPAEVLASAAFPAFEFTHPFEDGNGHVGRMLV